MQISWIKFTPGEALIQVNTSNERRFTYQVPDFGIKLLKILPDIKHHKCDNPKNLTFVEELEDTSIAHVFEHIVLEIISQKSKTEKKLKGLTSWNWHKEPRGIYNIEINVSQKELVLGSIDEALQILDFCLNPSPVN